MREPSMMHRLAAEFIGTFWLVFGGCGSAVFAAKFSSDGTSVGIGFLGVALAFGLTVLTGMFLLVILGSTDDRAPKGFAGLSIGLTLALIHLISIPISNTSVNPARSTGVAFFNADGAPAQLWVFWLAPLVGAAIAGTAYPYLFGRNEELAERPVRDDALEQAEAP